MSELAAGDRLDPRVYSVSQGSRRLKRIRALQEALDRVSTPDRMRVLGSELAALLPKKVRRIILEGLQWAQEPKANRLLRLFLEVDTDLQDLAWELLYDDGFFALRCAIVRYCAKTEQDVGPWPLFGPLQVVRIRLDRDLEVPATLSIPVDLIPSQVDMKTTVGVQTTEIPPAIGELERELQDHACHVLEYVGQGGNHPNPGAFVVLVEGEVRKEVEVGYLARLLDAKESTRVVALFPEPGQASASLFSTAEMLARSGRRACIAFRSGGDEQQRDQFRSVAYPQLTNGESLEMAVLQGRQKLHSRGLGWDQPALFASPSFEAPFERGSQVFDRLTYLQARLGQEINQLPIEHRGEAARDLYWFLTQFERQAIRELRNPFARDAGADYTLKMATSIFMNQAAEFSSVVHDTVPIEVIKQTAHVSKLLGPHDLEKTSIRPARYVSDIDIPAKIPIKEWQKLTVTLRRDPIPLPSGDTIERIERHDWDVKLQVDVRQRAETVVDVVVTTAGLLVYPQAKKHLVFRENTDPTPVEFWLWASNAGDYQIVVDFIQNGNYIGNAELAVTATEAQVASVQRALASDNLDFAVGSRPETVDATLVVRFQTSPWGAELSFFWCFPNGVITEPLSTRMRTSPQDWLHETIRLIRKKNQIGQLGDSVLDAVGHKLFDLVPRPLQDAYWEYLHADEATHPPKHVSIVTDDPWLPWELMKAYDKDREDEFLCKQYAVGRWLFNYRPCQSLVIDEARAVALPLFSLPAQGQSEPQDRDIYRLYDDEIGGRPINTEQELSSVLRLRTLGVNVQVMPGRKASLLEALQTGGFQLLHIAGHGSFEAEPEQSAIQLEDGELMAMEVGGRYARFGVQRPLVILNACHTGRQGYSLSGVGGWATAFARAGCGAFVGALWAVRDDYAAGFADYLYQELAKDQITLGEAVRRARLRLEELERQGEAPQYTWLAYVLFGNPLTRVGFPGGTHGTGNRH